MGKKKILNDNFEMFSDLCKEKKSYNEKIQFLVSFLNKLDRTKYQMRLDNSLLDSEESLFIPKEKIIQSIIEDRLNEDYVMMMIRSEPSFYCANEFYPLINYVINTDEEFKKKHESNTDFRRVSINQMLDIGISLN